MSVYRCHWEPDVNWDVRMKRATSIAMAFGCAFDLPMDRHVAVLLFDGQPQGEFSLLTNEERKHGEWVHAVTHSEGCPENA